MAKRKKLDAGQMVREMAREQVGIVPPTKAVPQKVKKTGIKHKKRDWEQL